MGMGEDKVLETNKTSIDPFDDASLIKVQLGEPSSGLIDCIAHDNRLDFYMELARLEARSKFKFFTYNVGRCQVNYARENMAENAMALNMDYLFMIDDDMIVPRRCFERVYDCMLKNNADIAAPLCTMRFPPFKPVIYSHVYEQKEDGMHFYNNYIEDYEPNSVVQVDGIGFGVVLISVPFLRKMKELMPKGMFFSNNNIGEDIWFCFNASKNLKARIFVDTSIKVGHLRHPEIATEWDYVQASGKQEKFKAIYNGNPVNEVFSIRPNSQAKR